MVGNKKEKTLEELNSEKLIAKVRQKIGESRGHAGNILQKVYYVNMHILSKLWYVAQSMRLDTEMMKQIDRECRN